MKFKFGDKIKVVKGKFHKGAVGIVVGFFYEGENRNLRRYRILLEHDNQIHASHSWLEKMNPKDELLK
jgi:hypothetical protein